MSSFERSAILTALGILVILLMVITLFMIRGIMIEKVIYYCTYEENTFNQCYDFCKNKLFISDEICYEIATKKLK